MKFDPRDPRDEMIAHWIAVVIWLTIIYTFVFIYVI